MWPFFPEFIKKLNRDKNPFLNNILKYWKLTQISLIINNSIFTYRGIEQFCEPGTDVLASFWSHEEVDIFNAGA